MNKFNNQFADFLAERMGGKIAWLKDNNKQYSEYLDKRSKLVEHSYDNLVDCQKALQKLHDLNNLIADIENNYLFVMGMQEYKNINDSVSSQEFINEFLGISCEEESNCL